MASSPPSTNLRERIEATARAFLSAYEEGSSQNDASIINRDVTADCTRYLLPASVPQAFGFPADLVLDTAQHQEIFARDIKTIKFKNYVIANLVVDVEARRAALTSVVDVHPIGGEAYPAEFAWFLYFNEDGSKVQKAVEFGEKDVILKMMYPAV